MSSLTLPNKSITTLNFQDFSFCLDECLAIVWIDYMHGGGEYDPVMRYRLSLHRPTYYGSESVVLVRQGIPTGTI